MMDTVKSTESTTDIVLEAAQAAIKEFADTKRAVDIENITQEYAPFVIDKILQNSKNIIVIDSDNELTDKYSETFKKYLDTIENFTIYSHNENNDFLNTKVDFKYVGDSEVEKLLKKNIKNAIVGDNTRYMIEKPQPIPSYGRFKDAILNIFSNKDTVVSPKKDIAYRSITNFGNKQEASKIIDIIHSIARVK